MMPKLHDDFHTGLGWMYAECCAALDRGEDPRTMDVPEMVGRAETDCADALLAERNNREGVRGDAS